jgi:L,D-transpeptidase YcbB
MTTHCLTFGFLTLLILLSACKELPDKKDFSAASGIVKDTLIEKKQPAFSLKTSIQEKLLPLTADSNARINTSVDPILFSGPALNALYQLTDFEAIWIDETGLNTFGKELVRLLQTTEKYGLNSKYYGAGDIAFAVARWHGKKEDAALATDIELSLSNAWLLLALHLHKGAVGQRQLLNRNFGNNPSTYASALLSALEEGKIQSRLEAFQPNHIHYRNLQKELAGFYRSKNVLPPDFNIRDHKKDSTGSRADAMQALFFHGYLDSMAVDPEIYTTALKRFQREHGLADDGVPGPNTRRLLLTDNDERYRRIALNIERWRSAGLIFPEEYLLVNIPAFEALLVKKEALIRSHRVIVGKPSTKTPELQSSINLVVVNPDWTVPQSIIRNEMRGKSHSYLSKYDIFQGGKKVSPGEVNWSAGGIKMVQPPGPTNALGLIKFMFNNAHSVYLHDTPNRNLFETNVRAYSHGCVRMQSPLEFGVYLLQRDGKNIDLDSLKQLVSTGKLTNIRLNKGLPIFLTYFTAFSDDSGVLQLYPDLYKKEEMNAAVLFFGRYDKSVDPSKGREAIPSIDALPELILPEDSAGLTNMLIP